MKSYTRLENPKFVLQRINSHLVLSVTSSPTLISRFKVSDQHFPGWFESIPDSPAIQTARSAARDA